MSKPTIGAQLYTCCSLCQTAEGLADVLEAVAKIGYTTVQVSAIGKDIDPKDVAKMLADNNLTCNATHMDWNDFVNNTDMIIEKNALWGCPHPAVGGITFEKYGSLDGIKQFGEELAIVAENLAAAGMDFSYHNHHHEFVKLPDGRTWLAALYEDISPDILKAEIDTHWVQAGGGSPAAWLKKVAGRMPIIHFKDMVIVDGEQRFAPIGEGNLDWPAIIDAAAEGGCEYAFVEQDNSYEISPLEALEISYRNLKALGLS